MQSYSHPDVFFCPLYNPPGVSDPLSSIMSGGSEPSSSSPFSSPPMSPSSGPSTPGSSSSTPSSSREGSLSPPTSPSPPSASREGSKKLQKYRRMCAKSGKPLLDFVAEVESRRIVHEKRKQISVNRRPGFARD
ncbi:hypothetical protein BD414DRAFT_288516 [Trametes punicea]|nr:hypothetical protein BD414DRAFT_288516 [Trametes punicea]